jgi:hypothetical protein
LAVQVYFGAPPSIYQSIYATSELIIQYPTIPAVIQDPKNFGGLTILLLSSRFLFLSATVQIIAHKYITMAGSQTLMTVKVLASFLVVAALIATTVRYNEVRSEIVMLYLHRRVVIFESFSDPARLRKNRTALVNWMDA